MSISIDPVQSDNQKISSSKLSRFIVNFSIKAEDLDEFEEVIIEQDGRGAINPAVIDEFNESTYLKQELTIISSSKENTQIRVYLQTTDGEFGPFTIPIPPYRILQIADKLVNETAGTKSIDELKGIYNNENKTEAVFNCLNDIENWISITTHFRLLNNAAGYSDSVKNKLNKEGTTNFISRQIALSEKDSSYTIPSMRALNQLLSTCESLSNIPELNKYYILERAVTIVHKNEKIDQLWDIEIRFDLAKKYWKELLWDRQMTAILARSALEGDIKRAQNIVEQWIELPEEAEHFHDDLKNISPVDGDESRKKWDFLLHKSISESNQEFLFVLCNFLDHYVKNNETDLEKYLREQIEKSRSILLEDLNIPDRARTAKFKTRMIEGQRLKSKNEFNNASKAFSQALDLSFEEKRETDQIRFTSPEWAIFWLFNARSKTDINDEKYIAAIDKISDGISILESLEEAQNEDTRQFCITRLKAMRHETRGDKLLSENKLDDAESQYGKAISKYKNVNLEDQVSYLIRRKALVSASIAEQNGDFSMAKASHQKAAEYSEDVRFKQFNQSRAEICAAKEVLVEQKYEKVREMIQPYYSVNNVVGVESQYIELLLEVIMSYENDTVLDTGNVFDKFNKMPDINEVGEEFLFEYGHDYRPALANILVAQKLKQFNIDNTIPDNLVQLALVNTFSPTQVEKFINEKGLSNIGLKEKWKGRVPMSTLRQYQSTIKIESSKIDSGNYKEIVDNITGILEEYLEFIVAYYTRLEYGKDWRKNIGSPNQDPSLRDLVNGLNNSLFEDLPWIDKVRQEISKIKYENVTKEDNEGTIVDLRNDLSHNNISYINKRQYNKVIKQTKIIFNQSSRQIPVLGIVLGKNQYDAYTVLLLNGGFKQETEIICNHNLDNDLVYYFPNKLANSESVKSIDSENIIPCEEHRILEGLEKHTYINAFSDITIT